MKAAPSRLTSHTPWVFDRVDASRVLSVTRQRGWRSRRAAHDRVGATVREGDELERIAEHRGQLTSVGEKWTSPRDCLVRSQTRRPLPSMLTVVRSFRS